MVARTRGRQVYRHLAVDASPQKGVEFFASMERVLTMDAASGSPIVEERRLPVVTLGHGRAVCLTVCRRTSTRFGWYMDRA